MKENNKFNNKWNLQIGIITVDLSDIKTPDGKQAYKDIFEKIKNVQL